MPNRDIVKFTNIETGFKGYNGTFDIEYDGQVYHAKWVSNLKENSLECECPKPLYNLLWFYLFNEII